jgi:hypothetical protein
LGSKSVSTKWRSPSAGKRRTDVETRRYGDTEIRRSGDKETRGQGETGIQREKGSREEKVLPA